MNEEIILERYEKYYTLLKKVFDPGSVDAMFEAIGDRIAICPLGQTKDEGGYPGAFVEFSLRVAQKAKSLAEEHDLVRSAIRVSLIHELGKVGDLRNDLFVEQDSSWHVEKLGQNYKYSEDCFMMNPSHRTLYLTQEFGLKLNQDEWTAIMMSHGYEPNESLFYKPQRHILTSIIQHARACAF